MRAILHARTSDGSVLADDLYLVGRSLEDLPPTDQIHETLRERMALLDEASSAPAWEDEYVGPVLFEEDAAADLFRWVLVRQLEGTPGEIPFESFFGDLTSGSSSDVRLGRRVLPQGWSVYDDPSEDLRFSGAFTHDNEGTPAQKVELVTDGIVRNALMSRVPRADLDASNGHARGSLTEVARGRASIVHVQAPRRDSARKIHKRALALASSYGHDHYVVIRQLQEPASRLFGDPRAYLTDDQALQLPPPLVAWRVYSDGREEMYRSVEISEVQRYALRDIAAVGEPVTMDYLASAYSFPAAEGAVQGLPTRITAPSVLVGELELFPAPPERQKPRLLDPPPTSGFSAEIGAIE